jgi:hypothetical protein
MFHRRRNMLKLLVASASLFFGLQAQAGIEEPEKIDAVANKPDSPYVVLLVTSNRAWNEKTFAMLEKKLAHYVHFVKSGQLLQGRPAAQEKKVRIVLVHEVTPDEGHKLRLLELRGKAESEGIQLVWGGKSEVLALASAP